jgi:hypothetical protein
VAEAISDDKGGSAHTAKVLAERVPPGADKKPRSGNELGNDGSFCPQMTLQVTWFFACRRR